MIGGPGLTWHDVKLALILGGLTLFVCGFLWLKTAGPASIERAEIVVLQNAPGTEGASAIVQVKLADGSIRSLTTSRRLMARCRVGDEVDLVRRRFSLQIGPRACLPEIEARTE